LKLKQKSIESRFAFGIGYFGVPFIYLLMQGGLSIEEVVRVLEVQSSLRALGSMIERLF